MINEEEEDFQLIISEEDMKLLAKALLNPPKPTERMIEMMKRAREWIKNGEDK